MERRMHNKLKISCQNFVNVFEGKEVRVFCCKQLHGWNGIEEVSGKWLICVIQPRFFLWLRSSHYLFYALKTPSDKEYSTMSDAKKELKSRVHYIKYCVWLNSESHRKLLNLTVIIGDRAHVKNRAVLVSFRKQHCVSFSIKWNSQFFANYWSLRPHLLVKVSS